MSGGETPSAARATGPASAGGDEALKAAAGQLRRALTRLGAHAGGLFLLEPGDQVLRLALLCGMPQDIAAPGERVSVDSEMPSTDTVRTGQLVWVNGQESWMRSYPRIAVAAPYDFSLAAVPVTGPRGTLGSLFAVWPGSLPSSVPDDLRDGMWRLAEGVAAELERFWPGGLPGVDEMPPLILGAPAPEPGTAEAAESMAARLPEGVLALDNDGRVTSLTPAAAELLGEPEQRLLGARPWDELPWLREPFYELYRAALLGGRPASGIIVAAPGDHRLSFDLYPDASGITVRVTRAADDGSAAVPAGQDGAQQVHAGTLHHVLHLASALTQAVSVQDIVDLVADEIIPAYGAQALALLTAEGRRLKLLGHHGYPPEVAARYDNSPWFPSQPGVRGLGRGRPAFYESLEELNRAFPERATAQGHDGMASWAFLPLIASGRHMGTCILAYARPHRFGTSERAVLTSLGGLIAQALDRARLYDKKLELAHVLQQGMLPRTLPEVPGLATAACYLPGTEGMDIGGDFYDLVRLRDDAAAAVIGDVQGHNVAAAALMGQIRSAVHAFATAEAAPGRILSATNRLLMELDPGLFASSAFLRLDLRSRTACLASAGHPHPLVRTPDGEVRVVRSPGGLLLGIEAESEYPVAEFPIPVGTTVVLYTDGLIESPGTDLDEALDALAADLARSGDLPLEELATVLIRRATTARHRTDDIALFLLRSVSHPGAG
ncbi:SpoIIE family protein phosphatase [Streptomyces sp. GC420]|uniref:SpoIIE family protein phosphatase n=1 Tax=Streptomyces sp. GC420 TaxID=2697568 RepID=UPI0014151251|nr:SpoIIE family protein phosphatase [Streptomyces sp. GC420]NBM19625.1 SpoIIE family protein phosphatase [Streptomyces sp. GC420]